MHAEPTTDGDDDGSHTPWRSSSASSACVAARSSDESISSLAFDRANSSTNKLMRSSDSRAACGVRLSTEIRSRKKSPGLTCVGHWKPALAKNSIACGIDPANTSLPEGTAIAPRRERASEAK